MPRKPPPSIRKLKELYQYSELTGDFIHKRQTARGAIGSVAGTLRKDGYIKISVDGVTYLAHHLAWLYVNGSWPEEIDHHDRVRSNNRISNLRDATRSQNNGNSFGWGQSKRKHKLPRGVYAHPSVAGRYRAQIVINRKQTHLGCFGTVDEAKEAYKKAALLHFREFALT